jgi:hypothetical protein
VKTRDQSEEENRHERRAMAEGREPMVKEVESGDRTGDVLLDAANDLRDDWPWYADAMLVMRNGLETIANRSVGPDAREARSVLDHAERLVRGERDSVEPLLPPNK